MNRGIFFYFSFCFIRTVHINVLLAIWQRIVQFKIVRSVRVSET